MNKKIDEFVNDGGTLISSKVPNTDPKTTAKTTTDKSMKMRAQPFMYSVYRRFFNEGDNLPHTEKADEFKNNPKKFHSYLQSIGEGESFESYFQKEKSPKDKLKEISKNKAYNVLETLLASKNSDEDVFNKEPITIDEIKAKETLLLDKLTRIAETIKSIMSEDEKKTILTYFTQKLK